MRSLWIVAVLFLFACASDDAGDAEAAAPGSGVLSDDALAAWLPDEVGELPLASTVGETEGALGAEISRATGLYTLDLERPSAQIVINLVDFGSADMVERMGFGWGLAGNSSEGSFDGFPSDAAAVTYEGSKRRRIITGERFLVEVKGEFVPDEALEEAIRMVDPAALADAGR